MRHSFELGGEKKTKGAALTFVSVNIPLATCANTLGIDTVMPILPPCLPFFVCVYNPL